MPFKEIVTLLELSAYLSAELQKMEDAAGSEIMVRYTFNEPDDEGCNWSDDVLLQVGQNTTKEALAPRAAQLVRNARKRFEVVD